MVCFLLTHRIFCHDRFLKVTFVNRPVSYIIDQVFSKDFGYLINGREVILYKKQVMVDDTGSQHKTMPPVSPKQVPDEPAIVIKYDTIFTTRFDTVIFTRSDTVFVRDTTVLKDTVYVPKLKKAPSGKKISFKNTRFSGKKPSSVCFFPCCPDGVGFWFRRRQYRTGFVYTKRALIKIVIFWWVLPQPINKRRGFLNQDWR